MVEDEIDLRPYIEALIKHWYWIMGTAVLAAILAFIVTSFVPPTYQATALVAVVPPHDVLQFDARIREITVNQPLRAFPQLALSDHVLQRLREQQPVADVGTIQDLRRHLEAEVGEDASIIQLRATAQDPVQAAALVNGWAAIFVEWTNDIYTGQGGRQAAFFEEQLLVTEVELRAAEEALVAFQAVNRMDIISNTLAVYANTQAEYLVGQRRHNQLMQQVQELRDQLAVSGNTQPVTLADQLTALSLQLQTFGVETAVPLQLQVNEGAILTGAGRNEQLAFLDNLLAALTTQVGQTEAELAALEPTILELQQQRQSAETEHNRLIRNRFVAEETYMALAHKVEEERITSQDRNSGVRLASEAAVPTKPESKHRLLNTAVAGLLAFLILVAAILFSEWWRISRSLRTR